MANTQEALPTQKFIDVKGVQNGVLILKSGGLRQIIAVTGLNFDLKSEDEQNAITYAYQNFLNSLNFTLQIFVHSRKVNIEAYLDNLKKVEAVETNPLLKTQINEYREFIKSFVSENAIMQKSFFVIIPFDSVAIPEGSRGFLSKFLGKSGGTENISQDAQLDLQRHMGQLAQRAEQVMTGLTSIGLRAIPLNDEEVIELFYNLYNPEATEKKGMELAGSAAVPVKTV